LTVKDIINRIDENILQQVFNKALPVINGVSEVSISIGDLKSALQSTFTSSEIVTTKKIFNSIIPILIKQEALDLSKSLNLKVDDDKPWLALERLRYTESDKQNLCAFFDIEYIPLVKTQVDSIIVIQPEYPLFPHQIVVQQKVQEILWAKDEEKVLIHMPTGSGKTRTCMNMVCDYLRSNPSETVIWFANTEELCQQASDEFAKSWKELGNRNLPLQNIWGGNTLNKDLESSFIVFGIQTFISLYTNDTKIATELSEKVSLVVMDEAHMAIAPKYQLAIDILLFNNAKLIGLSATPGRTWNDIDKDKELANYFNRKKVTLEIDGYENCVDFLIEQGYLAKVENSSLLYSEGIEPSEEDYKFLKDHLQLSNYYLKRTSEDIARNILIVSKVRSLIKKHNRIILFSINVKHSETLSLALSAIGIKSASISSKTDKNTRRRLIAEFKSEDTEPMVLCNYGVLTTGFDAPKTSCAVIARPTDSLVLYSQMVGRVIRGVEAGGNDVAEVVTVVDTKLKGFRNVADAFFNWEDVW